MKIWTAAILFGVSLQAMAMGGSSQDFADFRGRYQLADGRTLTMTSHGRRQIADIDGIGPVEVVAVDDGTFVARHGDLKLTFERWANGNVTDVSMEGAAPRQ